jgi:alanine dehydrogenase
MAPPAETLILTRSEVARLLHMGECIEAVETVFRDFALGKVGQPGVLGFHAKDGGYHIKVASSSGHFAAKLNANFPGNPDRTGLPTIQGVITLFDTANGRLLALMDSIEITGLRTAAATAVAARYLARKDAAIATICGCGVQGRLQLEAVHLVRPLRSAMAFDQDRGRAERFATELSDRLGIPVTPAADVAAAARASDIIVTCTPSRQPILGPGDVKPGAFIAAVGADNPDKQEIDPELLRKSTVVVDHLEQCQAFGDLHHAIKAGVMKPGDVAAELGAVVAGKHPGRRSPEEIIVFDSTGSALEDVAAASIVYQRAVQDSAARRVQLGS